MVIHEFTTNAVKHGALSVHSGSVQITWTTNGSNIQMKWKEIGGPPVKDPNRTGFGSNLVDLSVRAMGGTHVDSFSESGFECDLSFTNGARS
ncbi:MAG: sensor histidine kinase [Pseudolabrys sp.]